MSDVAVTINGVAHRVSEDVTVAAALFNAHIVAFRHDPSGRARAPLCGMGICFECRVTVDGVAETRSCLVRVRDGMTIDTP